MSPTCQPPTSSLHGSPPSWLTSITTHFPDEETEAPGGTCSGSHCWQAAGLGLNPTCLTPQPEGSSPRAWTILGAAGSLGRGRWGRLCRESSLSHCPGTRLSRGTLSLTHSQRTELSSRLTLDIFLYVEIILIASDSITAGVHSMGEGVEV